MKNEVVVDGIKLTKEQVCKAMKALNEPDYKFALGDVVISNKQSEHGRRYLVVGGDLNKKLNAFYNDVSSNDMCSLGGPLLRVTDGDNTWSNPIDWYTKVGSINTIGKLQ